MCASVLGVCVCVCVVYMHARDDKNRAPSMQLQAEVFTSVGYRQECPQPSRTPIKDLVPQSELGQDHASIFFVETLEGEVDVALHLFLGRNFSNSWLSQQDTTKPKMSLGRAVVVFLIGEMRQTAEGSAVT